MSLERQLLTKDLSCPLCFDLLYAPTTLHCGHTFCKDCLSRSLDVQTTWDRVHLVGGLATNFLLEHFLKTHFDEEYEERASAGQLAENWLPLFILDSTMLPDEYITLHVYEPRYRLMVRRCLMGSCKFGVIMGGYDTGTLANIISTHSFDDGRFLLRLKGERIFRVEERQGLDEYTVARVKWPESEGDYAFFGSYLQDLKSEVPSINFDQAPEDPHLFLQWLPLQLSLTMHQKQNVSQLSGFF